MKRNKKNLEEYKKPVPVKVQSYYDDLGKQKLLKEKIDKASKAIRKKYLALKTGKADEDETLNRIFDPIIEPLKDIAINTYHSRGNKKGKKGKQQQQQEKEIAIKKEPITPFTSAHAPSTSAQAPHFLQDEEVFSGEPEIDPDETIALEKGDYEDVYRSSEPAVLDDFLEQFPPLAREYIEGLYLNKSDYDATYGAIFDHTLNKLTIGNKQLHIKDNNDLKIDGKTFKGTKGLYELVFMKTPREFDTADANNYREILNMSNAHKRNHKPEEQMRGTKAYKYTNIIKPMFAEKRTQLQPLSPPMSYSMSTPTPSAKSRLPPPRSRLRSKSKPSSSSHEGSGMSMVYNEKPIEYVYWDDVNELVDRLRLLIASKRAGNTYSHDNEILSIVNELQEIGVIV